MARAGDDEAIDGSAIFLDEQQPDQGGDRRLEFDPEAERRGEGDRRRGEGEDRGTPRGSRDLRAENENLKKALHESRSRGRRLQAQIAEERARRDEQARRDAAERGARVSDEDLGKLREADGVAEAAPTLLDMADRRAESRWLDSRRSIAVLSQELARTRHADYDQVLEESGVRDMLSLDQSGRPRDPDSWQRIILRSDNPGEDAYGLALAILEEKRGTEPRSRDGYEELPPATGSRADGRRDVLRQFERDQTRPRGITDLPASSSGGPRRITFADIDKMSDEEYARLPRDIRDRYLGR